VKQSEAGFTLIELLVAMTAAGLLLASLSWSVSRLGRQLNPAENLLPEEEVAAFEPVLQSLVAGAHADDGEALVFSRNELRFVAAVPQALGGRGDADVRLRVDGSSGARLLEGEIRPQAEGSAPRQFRMSGRWDAIGIEPLKSEAGDRENAGVRFDFRKGERMVSLTASTKINTAADCVFDPISMACRP
jgi:prepilin-type N-terminal cleavage/methylation domain-containing protein